MAELTIADALNLGVRAHKAGKVQEADRYYTAILEAQPQHPDANHNMGVLAVGLGKQTQAVPFFEKALEANASIDQYWLSYVDALTKLQRLDDAQIAIEKAKSNGLSDELIKRLDCITSSQNIGSDRSPSQEEVDQLMVLYNQGQLAAVVGQTQKLMEQYPHAFVIWNILGAANKGLGRINEAVDAFKKATQLNPSNPNGHNNLGTALQDQGKLAEAMEAFNKALSLEPDYALAYNNMGNVLQDQGKLEEAMEALNQALSLKPDYSEAYYNMGITLQKQGKLDDAIEALNKALSLKPDYAEAYNNMGTALQEQGKLDEAIEALNKALSLKPDYAEAYNNMGTALQEQGKLDEAIEALNKALSLKPDYVEAYNNMGTALQDQGKLDEALEAYNQALSLKPDFAEAYYNMGNTLQEQDKPEEAIEAYQDALSLIPDYAKAYNNMGNALQDQGKLEEAIEVYKKALSLKPDYDEVYNNMGNALQEQGKLEEAIKAYKKSLYLKPDYAEAYNNMGNALQEQGKLEAGIEAYKKALSLKPDFVKAYYNMGNALQKQGKPEEAIEAYKKSLSLKPDYEIARANKLYQQAHICDWLAILEDSHLIVELGINTEDISPFTVLALEDAPERHCLRSELYARKQFPKQNMQPVARPLQKPERLRIGYFSTDFKEHPVAHLLAGVIENHDRNQFEIFGYSLKNAHESEMRQRLINSFDVFNEVSEMSHKEVALLARQDKIDIAIDLNGYTENCRTEIFAHRAAPIQVNYLGYPGTMGADFMDYIIADQNLIPNQNQKFYSEKPLFLPNTYMPTDNTRRFSEHTMSRSDAGLPEDSFVFCCFNKNYKISHREFDIWMRLLHKVEGSVLWLKRTNKISDKNLIKEAGKKNIDPSRLVFADRVAMDEHLSRHKLADVFLDSFAFNAHTTATEALWAGLPVVTKLGQGFAARVAGSLLNAIGLPELITETDKEYEALILKLATNPDKLAQVKEKLVANRLSQPLFDTEKYTKHIENGYLQAYEQYFEGREPEAIYVPE